MNKLEEIKIILSQMVDILVECNDTDWAKVLFRLRAYIDDDADEAIYQIISLYGGMGSLNDLILYKNSQLLQRENDIFDTLKSSLYNLCTTH